MNKNQRSEEPTNEEAPNKSRPSIVAVVRLHQCDYYILATTNAPWRDPRNFNKAKIGFMEVETKKSEIQDLKFGHHVQSNSYAWLGGCG